MRLRTIALALACCPIFVFGQDTTGVNQAGGNTGTVIKGKAPVAKDLLKVKFPKPRHFELSNGISVYVLEDHRAPVVRFNLQFHAGSIFEPKPGVASATASMLTEGTRTLSYLQIAEITEDMGANIGAGSSLDTVTLSAAGLSDSTEKLLSLMSDVLLHPSFPPDRVERIKFAQRSGLSQRSTNPAALISEMTDEVFYGGTRYARPMPTRQDLQAIQPEDLRSFYDTYYHPNGAILGVTGDINSSTLRAKLEAALGDWKAGAESIQLPSASFAPKKQPHIYLVDRPNSAQTVLQFGSLAVRATDSDYIALTVANRVLGGGSAGRLFQNIRERKGYTYGAYSSLTGAQWPGIWGANASVRTEVTEPAIGEFYAEFKRLQTEPVSQAELDRAKRSIIGGFALALQSPEGILARTLEQVRNNLPADYWETYPQRIEAVTPSDVQRVAQKYLGGGSIQLLVVGERKKIEPALAKYGPVQVIDPNKIAEMGKVSGAATGS